MWAMVPELNKEPPPRMVEIAWVVPLASNLPPASRVRMKSVAKRLFALVAALSVTLLPTLREPESLAVVASVSTTGDVLVRDMVPRLSSVPL